VRALLIAAIALSCAGFAWSDVDAQQASPGAGTKLDAKTDAKAGSASRMLDLSTPQHPPRRVVTHGEPLRAPAGQGVDFGKSDLGRLDLGGSQLRVDGSRKGRDLTQEVTGFDSTPGSTTFRQLAPSQKSGTPSYFGLTLSRPN